jgi:hypothetical protein
MDKYIISILSSLNFPDFDYYKFSERPTPYVISRRYGYSPASVYKTWKILEKVGALNKLIFIPAYKERFFYIITGVSQTKLHILECNLDNLYFLEFFYTVKIYRGKFREDNMSCSDGVFLSILADSSKKAYSSSVILCNIMGIDYHNILDININQQGDLRVTDGGKLLKYMAYSNFSNINFFQVSQVLHISERSVRRRLNLLLQQRKLELLPILDQRKIPGINTAMAIIIKSSLTSSKINQIPVTQPPVKIWIKENRNFYSIFFIYSTLEQLDTISEEMYKSGIDYFIFIRFNTTFNTVIKESLFGHDDA